MTVLESAVDEPGGAFPRLAEPRSADAIIENAHAILPIIEEDADQIERLARLTPRAAQAMRASGVFQMAFPASRGGVEMTVAQQVDVVALISAVDASAGWNVGVLNATGYYAGRLDDRAYAELYPTRDKPTSGSFHPRGRAERVPGGYLVSGEWNWGSGSYTAEHIIGGANVFEGGQPLLQPNGKPLHLGLWLPRSSIEMKDDWQVLGVRGSGSTTFSIAEPAFVPAHHSFDREAEDTDAGDPLNKSVGVSHVALTGVVLGVARHAVQLMGEMLRARRAASHTALDLPTAQALGEAMAEVDFAYAGVRAVAKMTDETIFTPGGRLSTVQRARMTAANAAAAQAMRRVLSLCTDVAASTYIFDRNPLQRVMRDGLAAIAHVGTRRVNLGAVANASLDDPDAGFSLIDDPSWTS